MLLFLFVREHEDSQVRGRRRGPGHESQLGPRVQPSRHKTV
ncbi:MAG TPA: hypothetical protein VFY32_18755 [Solirubrobacteraceae bacterium]|nr:hypothetical protein [Solirubrobacteraceae bacterium]